MLYNFSGLPKSLEDSIANRYGPEALSEIQNFKGKDFKISNNIFEGSARDPTLSDCMSITEEILVSKSDAVFVVARALYLKFVSTIILIVSGSTIFRENKGDLKKNIEILRKN